MPAIFGNVGASAGEVNDFHLNSDLDKSTLSQHHTLGPQPNQASPGDHSHDGKTSRRLNLANMSTPSITFQPEGGTLGTQPTFSGDPLIHGSYILIGTLCHFHIDVDFDNITSFGSGQYYLTLPFTSRNDYFFREGSLYDVSGNDTYAMSGRVAAGTNTINLMSVASNGRDVAFTYNVPVTLAVADSFHIAGTYEIQP